MLAEGTRSSGPHAIAWDGRDDRGAKLGGGIYFVRLTAGSTRWNAKVVLIAP